MRQAGTTTRQAIEAVARDVGAAWEPCATPWNAILTLAGRRIALTVARLDAPRPAPPRARLREDRVALRFVAGLEAAVGARMPDDRTLIVTLAAPIRLANRTLATLTPLLSDRVAGGSTDTEDGLDILGNRIRFLILADGAAWTARVAGFVFTKDPGPLVLANTMRDLTARIAAAAADAAPPPPAASRWLVLAGTAPILDAATCRRALTSLAVPGDFERTLMVRSGGVEVLSG